jgi:hypothetical protein
LIKHELGYCFLEFELVQAGYECGDEFQISLSQNTSDPETCVKLIIANPACGEYFEIRRIDRHCRCTPTTDMCLMKKNDVGTIYRSMKKRGKHPLFLYWVSGNF